MVIIVTMVTFRRRNLFVHVSSTPDILNPSRPYCYMKVCPLEMNVCPLSTSKRVFDTWIPILPLSVGSFIHMPILNVFNPDIFDG